MEKLKFITSCEVCGNNTLMSVLDLGLHPLCDDLIPIGDSTSCIEYPIDIVYCPKCHTAHQRYQVEKTTLFTSQYHYRAKVTQSVLDGMSGLVEGAEIRYGNLRQQKSVGYWLQRWQSLELFRAKGCVTYGVDPTGAIDDASPDHHLIKGYFDDETVRKTKALVGQF